jgi:hypothetical protein
MSSGAVYIITQDQRYLDLALTSAASLIFSQFPIESPLFEKVHLVEPTRDGFYDKSRLIRNSPYERTLLIDADTYVLEAVPELFSLLDQFDCAATHEEYLNTDWHNRYPRPDIPESFPELNTGILMLKRSERVDRMLEEWGRLYKEYLEQKPDQAINDQPFFRVAAYYSQARIATLTREYNCKFRGQGYLNGKVKILHGNVGLKLEPWFAERAAAALNASTKPRVYIAGTVYDQKLVGKFADRRRAHQVGTFPLLTEPELWAEAKGWKKAVQQRRMRNLVAQKLAAK